VSAKPIIQIFLQSLHDEKANETARRMPYIKRDFKVRVCYQRSPTPIAESAVGGEEGFFKDSGVELIPVEIPPLPPDDRLKPMEAFVEVLKKDPPDLALAAVPDPTGAAFLIAARAAGVPLVLAELDDNPSLISTLEELTALHFSDMILPETRQLQRALNHALPSLADRPQILSPHSADTTYIQLTKEDRIRLRQNLRVDEERKMITMIAPLDHRRDHATLLQACALLRERGNDFILLLVGDGPERQHIADQICSLQLQDQVFMMEDPGEHQDILLATDIFALSSHFEGNNPPLLEAMAIGLAIAGTDIPGIGDWIRDKRSGRLAAPDNPESMAEALTDLLAQEKIRKKLGSVARKCVENRGNLGYFMPILTKALKSALKELEEKGKAKKSRAKDCNLAKQYLSLQRKIRGLWADVAPSLSISQAAQMLDGFAIHTQVDLLEKLCDVRVESGPLALLVRPIEKVLGDRLYKHLPLLEMRLLEKLSDFYMQLSYAEGVEKLIERLEQNMNGSILLYQLSRDRFAGLRAHEKLSRLYEFLGKADQREFYRLEMWDYMRLREGQEEDAYFHQQNAAFLESLGEMKLAARELQRDTLGEVRMLESVPIARLAPEVPPPEIKSAAKPSRPAPHRDRAEAPAERKREKQLEKV
jgi:glycosyltransferase involved in cell wall biosynthesis